MELVGEEIKGVIIYRDYGGFQKENIAIDFILIVVVQWKFKYSFKVIAYKIFKKLISVISNWWVNSNMLYTFMLNELLA